ncbi:hydrolase [Halofilum ochraceum]|uniref:hydrolase n=1 Tax=Halofilum ochraceum TaxID=1611323 RepID=UPI0008368D71|nr:hydrolase [Halofilum ochraceum]
MSAPVFEPAVGLRGPHRQTLGAWLMGAGARPEWRPERMELADGDFVDLAHLPGTGATRVCLFHGLEGCIDSQYIGALASELNARGHAVTFMHFRGCSGEPNRLPRAYHSGDTGDIEALLAMLREREATVSMAAIGFSLGGNALLKYLGERAAAQPLDAAVAVSVPFDLAACAERINQGFSRVYQRWLIDRMKRSTHARARRIGALPIDLAAMDRVRTFREFDDCVTAPLHGFDGVDDYYARASSAPWLQRVVTPTLLIQALDDPFVGPEPVPGAADVGASTERAVSPHGGHVGFLSGRAGRPARWLPRAITDWLDARLPAMETSR